MSTSNSRHFIQFIQLLVLLLNLVIIDFIKGKLLTQSINLWHYISFNLKSIINTCLYGVLIFNTQFFEISSTPTIVLFENLHYDI